MARGDTLISDLQSRFQPSANHAPRRGGSLAKHRVHLYVREQGRPFRETPNVVHKAFRDQGRVQWDGASTVCVLQATSVAFVVKPNARDTIDFDQIRFVALADFVEACACQAENKWMAISPTT